jgi:transcriptional regulator with XRE-family HTH domain
MSGATAQADGSSHRAPLGNRLKALRLSKSLTLSDVAAQTDISKSFLALVEAGRTDISIGRLLRLSEFFGVSLIDLLPAADREGPSVVRRKDRRTVNSQRERIRTELLAADTGGKITSMLATIGAKGQTKEYRQHPGMEFVLVLEGELTINFEDGSATVLAEGDSACFDSGRSHSYSNSAGGQTQFLSLSHPES